MNAAEFAERLAARAAQTEAALDRLLPSEDGPAGRVAQAMRYAALGGGKRLRAFLTLECAALLSADEARAERAAAAVECVHAYSLVHDDLPAMDDDDLRRGRPTTHIAFDEATAILAGDALLTLAFEILAEPATHPDASVRCRVIAELATSAGALGMVGGQMMDIDAEQRARDGSTAQESAHSGIAAVEQLQALKTGRLIRAAALIGAVLGDACDDDIAALSCFADRLGLAFQIQDDLLDLEGDESSAGKRVGKDAAAGKATFISLLGADGARARAEKSVEEALAALERFGEAAHPLAGAARFAISRAH